MGKYEEALERAKAGKPLDEVFPELKESEDDRIRKCIRMALTDVDEQRFKDFGITLADCLAYLEKQKEKPSTIGDIAAAYQFGLAEGRKDQQPAEWRPYDKEVLTKIKELIDSHFSEHEQREVYKDWLDEHISQPAEWSEEDEQWLESIIKDYEDSLVKDKDHAAVIKIKIDFLKSLRPQPNWKPSEEQIQVFKQTLTNFIEDCIDENLENTTPENKDNHEGYHQACWDILYFIKQASK